MMKSMNYSFISRKYSKNKNSKMNYMRMHYVKMRINATTKLILARFA